MGMIESAAENDHVAVLKMALEEVSADFERAQTPELRSMLSRTIGLLTRDLRAAENHARMLIKTSAEEELSIIEDELDALRKMKGTG